ncbi:Rhomboid protease GlpG [Candidatus Xiphinematobacter sp. Idaho Grape]|uniref:rhomboid family intramembrane serine protease n=1 Tax=Candidatus Xiphinematobacter sp. Idaho Grape TaxID=1704307 RepID=UPI000705BCCE|nr:rhomboid family intramembrane serine protease [Candidatus Xiphinematobacter sp. Idaho Grape]ALJ56456.1 Rhomboid protease GlpG [Candidatus Xiphinematobacter sp. Idaho Grape]
MDTGKKIGIRGVLICVNTAVFSVFCLLPHSGQVFVERWFGLNLESILCGAVWQVVTYQFVHATPFHLLANMLTLWVSGRVMEWKLGLRQFLILYLVGGAVGGMMQLILQDSEAEILGASAAVCSVLMGFCTLYARHYITALFFFFIPLKLPARCLGWGIVFISLAFAITGWLPEIGHLAHLGGCIFGFLVTRFWMRKTVV